MAGRREAAAAGGEEEQGPPDVDVTISELMRRPGVSSYFIFNDASIPIKWSPNGFPDDNPPVPGTSSIPRSVTHCSALVSDLSSKCKDVCHRLFASDHEPDASKLTYFRLRTNTKEIIVAPGAKATLVIEQAAGGAEAAESGEGEGKEEEE